MRLKDILKKDNLRIVDTYPDTDSFYADFALFLHRQGVIREWEKVKRLFIKREGVHSTAIGKGAASPHIYTDEFKEFVVYLVSIRQGLDFKAPDGEKVFLVFLIMSDERDVGRHLKTLAHIARLVNGTGVVAAVKNAHTPEELLAVILDAETALVL